MTEDPVNIINEYLGLVREKLPEEIADDVISELETYMLETARDQGIDGEITIESAKKVVAQFGAPGEVADEYRFSMLPEAIAEEDIPPEVIQDTQESVPIVIDSEEPQPVQRHQGIDPTSSPTAFFIKASILSIMWMVPVVIVSYFFGPFGYLSWQQGIFFAPMFSVIILIGMLMLLAFDHKWQGTILWKRSYPEWSWFQVLVTLPENSLPPPRIEYKVIDVIFSLCGIVLISPYVLYSSIPLFAFMYGIPALIFLIGRIVISVQKLRKMKDPLTYAKYEFVCNFSLLVILNASIWWVMNYNITTVYLSVYLRQLHLIYVILMGVVLLYQIVTGAENLWWKTEDESDTKAKEIVVKDEDEGELIESFFSNAGRLYAEVIMWIVIYSIIQIYLSLTIVPHYQFYETSTRLAALLIGISVAGISSLVYFLGRYIVVTRFNYVRIIGQRTRAEALIDGCISSLLLFISLGWVFSALSGSLGYNIIYYQELGSFQLAYLLMTIQIVTPFLIFLGLVFRLAGDILEFGPTLKSRATHWIEQSGILLISGLTLVNATEYINHILMNYYHYDILYWLFLPVILFLAFQVSTSSIKLRKMKEEQSKTKRMKSKNMNHSIANQQ